MRESERRFKSIPMFGYFNVYLYLKFDDETITVCEASMDFSKPLTQEIFDNIANVFVDYYAREVYEQLNEKTGTTVELSFDGDNVEVKTND